MSENEKYPNVEAMEVGAEESESQVESPEAVAEREKAEFEKKVDDLAESLDDIKDEFNAIAHLRGELGGQDFQQDEFYSTERDLKNERRRLEKEIAKTFGTAITEDYQGKPVSGHYDVSRIPKKLSSRLHTDVIRTE